MYLVFDSLKPSFAQSGIIYKVKIEAANNIPHHSILFPVFLRKGFAATGYRSKGVDFLTPS
jgi:hypothetical protein